MRREKVRVNLKHLLALFYRFVVLARHAEYLGHSSADDEGERIKLLSPFQLCNAFIESSEIL
jgi:hypothetical protein